MKRQPVVRRWHAIDPGDRWCGVATLEIDGPQYTARTSVLDAHLRTFTNLAKEVVPRWPSGQTTVVTETFQLRGTGHQKFSHGDTLRLIGAIRFCSEERGYHWTEVAAGNPEQLKQLVFGDYITSWREDWPSKSDIRWQHARSAWRILASHLFKVDQKLLLTLRRPRLPTFYHQKHFEVYGGDLVAPITTWEIRA